ncbi:PREDICTED: ATP-binding cassette sub-family A member 3-like [Dipodomys ordii]|uniref:ATP-binding cassette sub-family A member 3-like n=1 Tax=Dipodomys ordii TaxID=10020 RepID=A0A1S3EQM7_DIPOR|nr:PREDICTED: ATP-binding cassette sub-family A member 3-like [Dipodomys ordii]
MPLIFSALVLYLRFSSIPKTKPPTSYHPIDVSSLPEFFYNYPLKTKFQLVYIPSRSETLKALTEIVEQTFDVEFEVLGFSSESLFESYILKDPKAFYALVGIVFGHNFSDSNEPLPLSVEYSLRFSYIQRNLLSLKHVYFQADLEGWCTSFLYPPNPSQEPREIVYADGGTPGYHKEGFLAIQHAVDKAIMWHHAQNATVNLFESLSVLLQRFPYGPHVQDKFFMLLQNEFPLLLMLSFICIELIIINSITLEKERKLKDYMCMMGLDSWLHWIAWFIMFFISVLIAVSVMTVLFCTEVTLGCFFYLVLGLTVPSSGQAYINGYDISTDMVQIRKSMGWCPQKDILFENLTVAEQLSFYAQLKGLSPQKCPEEVKHMLYALNMEDKRNSPCKYLSGGMKRKLSIGIALIAGSKLLILDEPTSGMDAISRRAIWDLLQQQKSDRTILLTTHFMDEADLLGDRIAIMADGELQCCGSSLFLKQKYGAGYYMTLLKTPFCDTQKLCRLIYHHIPNAVLESDVAEELIFILPKESTHRFESLFADLELNQSELAISSFAASVTTMEEVFIRSWCKNDCKEVGGCKMFGYPIEEFLLRKAKEEPENFDRLYVVAASFEVKDNATIVTALFNNQAYHSPAVALALVDNLLFRLLSGASASITTSNYPQPQTEEELSESLLYQGAKGYYLIVNLLFGIAFLSSSFSILTVRERCMKSKQLQFVSGVCITAFWFSALLWDLISSLIPTLLLMVVFLYYNEEALTQHGNAPAVVLMLMLYAWAIIPFIYMISFSFDNAGNACVKLVIILTFLSIGPTVLVLATSEQGLGYTEISQSLDHVFLIFPGHCLGMAFSNLYYNFELKKFCSAKNLSDTECNEVCDGGNKRKLSIGIALIGEPAVIFLDEPSTGMDPVARRLLWDTVARARESGKAIVITSHSMEECEALCTRLAIMVQGQFKCVGSPQHLKSKFGSGYSLQAKVHSEGQQEALEEFKAFVDLTFPGSVLEDEHQGLVCYHLPGHNLCLSKVFGSLEKAKRKYKLEDYSINQVSLEDVFLSFTNPIQPTQRKDQAQADSSLSLPPPPPAQSMEEGAGLSCAGKSRTSHGPSSASGDPWGSPAPWAVNTRLLPFLLLQPAGTRTPSTGQAARTASVPDRAGGVPREPTETGPGLRANARRLDTGPGSRKPAAGRQALVRRGPAGGGPSAVLRRELARAGTEDPKPGTGFTDSPPAPAATVRYRDRPGRPEAALA